MSLRMKRVKMVAVMRAPLMEARMTMKGAVMAVMMTITTTQDRWAVHHLIRGVWTMRWVMLTLAMVVALQEARMPRDLTSVEGQAHQRQVLQRTVLQPWNLMLKRWPTHLGPAHKQQPQQLLMLLRHPGHLLPRWHHRQLPCQQHPRQGSECQVVHRRGRKVTLHLPHPPSLHPFHLSP
jgi:hypothetical protein